MGARLLWLRFDRAENFAEGMIGNWGFGWMRKRGGRVSLLYTRGGGGGQAETAEEESREATEPYFLREWPAAAAKISRGVTPFAAAVSSR